MKYYGSIYKGIAGEYDISHMRSFDDPYDALKTADNEWNATPDSPIARLLLVIRAAECGEPAPKKGRAHFHFRSSESTERFISNRSEILWSDNESQSWNGDAGIMGTI